MVKQHLACLHCSSTCFVSLPWCPAQSQLANGVPGRLLTCCVGRPVDPVQGRGHASDQEEC